MCHQQNLFYLFTKAKRLPHFMLVKLGIPSLSPAARVPAALSLVHLLLQSQLLLEILEYTLLALPSAGDILAQDPHVNLLFHILAGKPSFQVQQHLP